MAEGNRQQETTKATTLIHKKMNIKQLLEANANISVCVSLTDLCEFFAEVVAEAAAKPQEVEETYLTTDEVCEMLHVSPNTLWRWDKRKYLCAVRIGRTPHYLKSEVVALLKGKGA